MRIDGVDGDFHAHLLVPAAVAARDTILLRHRHLASVIFVDKHGGSEFDDAVVLYTLNTEARTPT